MSEMHPEFPTLTKAQVDAIRMKAYRPFIVVAILLSIGLFYWATRRPERDLVLENCVDRGIAYFIEIRSYPTLKTAPDAGRRADEVALERCRRTPTAFR